MEKCSETPQMFWNKEYFGYENGDEVELNLLMDERKRLTINIRKFTRKPKAGSDVGMVREEKQNENYICDEYEYIRDEKPHPYYWRHQFIYLTEDRKSKVCFKIYNRTGNDEQANILEIRKSLEKKNNDPCRTVGNNGGTTFFARKPRAVECRATINGQYHFSYELSELSQGSRFGQCDNSMNRLVSCTDPSSAYPTLNQIFSIKYRPCPSMHGSMNKLETLKCLGSWEDDEGNRFSAVENDEIGNDRLYDKYRCLIMNKDQPEVIGKSKFAQCNNLDSPTIAPIRHRLTPVIPDYVEAKCTFPQNLRGDWINTGNMNARVIINSTHMTEEITVSNRGWKRRTYYVCQQSSRQQYLVKSLTEGECFVYYICLDILPRHHNILRFRRSKSFSAGMYLNNEQFVFFEVCSWTSFDGTENWKYSTMILYPPAPTECPFTGMFKFKQFGQNSSEMRTRIRGGMLEKPRDNGFYIQCDKWLYESQVAVCGDQTKYIGVDVERCAKQDSFGTPVGIYEMFDYVYWCAGHWREDSRSYMITYDQEAPFHSFRCWVYERSDLRTIKLSRAIGSSCGFDQRSTSSLPSEGADLLLELEENERIHDELKKIQSLQKRPTEQEFLNDYHIRVEYKNDLLDNPNRTYLKKSDHDRTIGGPQKTFKLPKIDINFDSRFYPERRIILHISKREIELKTYDKRAVDHYFGTVIFHLPRPSNLENKTTQIYRIYCEDRLKGTLEMEFQVKNREELSSSSSEQYVGAVEMNDIAAIFKKHQMIQIKPLHISQCFVCKKYLWSVKNFAYRCIQCGITCHSRCLLKIVATCLSLDTEKYWLKRIKDINPNFVAKRHDFVDASKKIKQICFFCNQLIGLLTRRYRCKNCHHHFHPQCIPKVPRTCGAHYNELRNYLKQLNKNDSVDEDAYNPKHKPHDYKETYKQYMFRSNEFTNIKQIGKGSFGTVYRAFCITNEYADYRTSYRQVVLKKQSKTFTNEKVAFRELTALRRIVESQHEVSQFFVTLYASFETAQTFFFILEYANKGTLDQFIKIKWRSIQKNQNKETFHRYENFTLKIVQQLFRAIDYLHRTIELVHCDIKSENVALTANYDIRIIDFGLSRNIHEAPFPSTLLGTYGYMAPEILEKKPFNQFIDFWSLGIVYFQLFTGKSLRKLSIMNDRPATNETVKRMLSFVTDKLILNFLEKFLIISKDERERTIKEDATNHEILKKRYHIISQPIITQSRFIDGQKKKDSLISNINDPVPVANTKSILKRSLYFKALETKNHQGKFEYRNTNFKKMKNS
ncbi:hypothetical protein SNEBB_001849 [Seison nebaliae]|nr:hypothetical protein SNEBB_001849 [Seison nebaliae]